MYLRIYLALGRAREGNTRTEKGDDKIIVVNSNMANFKFFIFFSHHIVCKWSYLKKYMLAHKSKHRFGIYIKVYSRICYL